MTDSEADWLNVGEGIRPEQKWSFTADAPLLNLKLARETGEILVADSSGGLYLLDRRGQIVNLMRGFQHLNSIAWSDTGSGGAACVGDKTLCVLDRNLKVSWSLELADDILDIAVDPFGNYFAAALANGNNLVFDRHKNRVCRFDTVRPLRFLSFVPSVARIVGAAEYGLICCHELTGAQVWNEKTWSNVGDLYVAGGVKSIYMAVFGHGIQSFAVKDGNTRGSYLVEGTPNHVSTSYKANRISVSTVERQLYWLDSHGELIWATHLADDASSLQCGQLGESLVCGLASGRVVSLEWGIPEGE